MYVVGHARPYFTDLADVSIHKMGPDGNVLWEDYYRDFNIDRARSVTVYGDDVYVVGKNYWRLLDMQVFVMKYVSPNTVLTPDESRFYKLSPLIMGTLLLIVAIYAITHIGQINN